MGPKPTMNGSQLASARTLNNLRTNIALPPPLYSRIFSAPLDDQIHLFAMGTLPGETRHVVLDKTGEIVNEGTTLPKIQVEGIAICRDEIILINGQPEADRLQLIAFDKHSTMKWKFELPVARSEARYPDLCCPPDRLQVIWLVGRDPAVHKTGQTLRIYPTRRDNTRGQGHSGPAWPDADPFARRQAETRDHPSNQC